MSSALCYEPFNSVDKRDANMNSLTNKPIANRTHASGSYPFLKLFKAIPFVALLTLCYSVHGQTTVIDNFNSYTNPGDETNVVTGGLWRHYTPGNESPSDGGQ